MSYWVHYWTSIATRVSGFDGAIKRKKTQKLAELYCRTGNMYVWLQTLWSSQIEKNNYILCFIMTLHIFEYQYNFISVSLWALKNTIFEQKMEKKPPKKGGRMFDNGNGKWRMLGRVFFCQTGHFCVKTCILVEKPGIFVSNRAFLCRTSVIMYHIKILVHFPISFGKFSQSPKPWNVSSLAREATLNYEGKCLIWMHRISIYDVRQYVYGIWHYKLLKRKGHIIGKRLVEKLSLPYQIYKTFGIGNYKPKRGVSDMLFIHGTNHCQANRLLHRRHCRRLSQIWIQILYKWSPW